jgi:hypothetical protein
VSDPLQALLDRAKKRASLIQQDALKKRLLKKQARRIADALVISEDYASRLQDKATFRRLLSDDPMDAARFRWYFEHFKNNRPIDEVRKWIDHCMTHT